tara:strand:- start:1112 stop:1303 length:192 start_codon:yes stop_codon:yes gene_type:complete
MTPKEKAIELVDTMKSKMYSDGYDDAKECALVCVDENCETSSLSDNENLWVFWQEVKQEIEKL